MRPGSPRTTNTDLMMAQLSSSQRILNVFFMLLPSLCVDPKALTLSSWFLHPIVLTINLVYPMVYFDEHGMVWHSQWNHQIILCKEPLFGHPILFQVINMLAFQGHLLIASVVLNLFNPVPLPLIALACTLVQFALNHYVPGANSNKCMKLSADDYHPVYQK
ncbi:hypothetical protein K439DRAFT_1616057 [Ramaria rubella]|nr:hypothetical protein K439DRAFT_1616057 [Ramaria rubella]